MRCCDCKTTYIASTTTHTVTFEEGTVIVKNVPCLKCPTCNDIAYTGEVSIKLDQIVQFCREFLIAHAQMIANEIEISFAA